MGMLRTTLSAMCLVAVAVFMLLCGGPSQNARATTPDMMLPQMNDSTKSAKEMPLSEVAANLGKLSGYCAGTLPACGECGTARDYAQCPPGAAARSRTNFECDIMRGTWVIVDNSRGCTARWRTESFSGRCTIASGTGFTENAASGPVSRCSEME